MNCFILHSLQFQNYRYCYYSFTTHACLDAKNVIPTIVWLVFEGKREECYQTWMWVYYANALQNACFLISSLKLQLGYGYINYVGLII